MKLINNFRFYLFLIYFSFGLFLLPYLKYYVDCPDTFQYLTIARKYSCGQFYEAINSHWSPFISWLLVPAYFFHCDSILYFKILQLGIGGFALWNLVGFMDLIPLNITFKRIAIFSFIPVFISYAFLLLTPDLLFLSFLLLYLRIAWKEINSDSVFFPIATGIVASMLYFAKAFGFPFFIFHFSLVSFVYLIRGGSQNRKQKIKKYLISVLIFIFLSGAWITLLEYKYHRLMISSAPSYNFNPDIAPTTQAGLKHPICYKLFAPPNATAVCILEDILELSNYMPRNSLFESRKSFTHYLQVIKRNVLSIYYFDFRRQLGSLLIVALLAFFFFIKKPFKKISPMMIYCIFSYLLYASGYAMILVMPRYIWACTILMAIIILMFIELLFEQGKSLYITAICIFFFTIFLMIKRPFKEIFFSEDRNIPNSEIITSVISPLTQLEKTYSFDKSLFSIVDTLSCRLGTHKKTASQCRILFNNRSEYGAMTLLNYYTNNYFYGLLPDDSITNGGERQLKKYNIDYYFVWNPDSLQNKFVKKFQLVYYNEGIHLHVYSVQIDSLSN